MPSGCEVSGRVIGSPDRRAWEEYVQARTPRGIFHSSRWARVLEVYQVPYLSLAAVRGDQIVGVLPLALQRSRIFGSQVVSLPWFDAVGLIADDQEARECLVRLALEIAREHRAQVVQLRQDSPLDLSPHVRADKVLMRLGLDIDRESLWNSLKAKVRNQVRKGQKSGLVVEQGGRELLADFYKIYSQNMRDLGSPSHSARFFEAVHGAFPEESRLYRVSHAGRAVGAAWTIANGDSVEVPWASSLQNYNGLCVNHVMYWHAIDDACRRGFRWFHFGRSTRESGTWRFKKQWGAEEVPLFWYFVGRTGAKNLTPPQDAYGLATWVWKRLPLWLSRMLGPRIIANVS